MEVLCGICVAGVAALGIWNAYAMPIQNAKFKVQKGASDRPFTPSRIE
jgi:hypothetical protein